MKTRVLPLFVTFLLGLAGVLTLAACAEFPVSTPTPGPTATATLVPSDTPSPTTTPLPPVTQDGTPTGPTGTPTVPADAPTLLAYKIADPDLADPGDLITYAVIILNDIMSGADPGTRVVVLDTLPASVTYVQGSVTSGATFDAAQNTIRWEGSVARGGSTAISFRVRVSNASPGERVENRAIVTDAFGRVVTVQTSTLVRGASVTPEPTNTPVSTVPVSPTAGVTPTATDTPSPSPTSPGPTVSPTQTASPTVTPTLPPTLTPTRTPSPTPIVFRNWRSEYYDNRTLSGNPVLVRDDAVINFDWGTGSPASQVPSDNFAVRWTREVEFEGGTWRFYVTVDDGVRLWVDGALLIDAWYDGSERTVVGSRSLVRGRHEIRLEYYEHLDEALVRLWWEKDTSFPDWRGEYYANRNLDGPVDLVRNDLSVNFDWGTGSPASGLPANDFSVRWTRTATFDAAPYQFNATVDDGVRVWVDGNLVIDEWADGATRTVSATRAMVRGVHSIRVEYYERLDQARIHVWWQKVENFPDWRGDYWWNRNLDGAPALVRNDRSIDFDWGFGAPAPNMPADNFSARWRRTLSFEEGTYRFHALADDVVRVWVDDVLIIDGWTYTPDERTADRFLTQGSHRLRVEYAEYTGQAMVRVWWEQINAFPDWKGEYWTNPDLGGAPRVARNDPDVNFNFGFGAPAPGIPADNWSARWTREVNFDGGTFRFHVAANGAVRLWVDDVLLLGSWGAPTSEELTAISSLLRGVHRIRLEYADRGGSARIHLWWERVEEYPDWKGEYWANPNLSGPPALVRNDVDINFDWGNGASAPGLPTDNFSARWTRTLFFPAATYRFRALADDLVRVWVDGALVINQWDVFDPNVITAEYPITRGEHQIRVEYVERGGSASVRVDWAALDVYPGWKGEYFTNPDLAGAPYLVRNDPEISFNWGQGSVVPGMPNDNFSVRWTRVLALNPGVYRLHARADDGIRIFVDGGLVLDEWHLGTGQEYTTEVTLTGRHEFRVEYFDQVFEARVSFWYEFVRGAQQPPLAR